MSGTFSSFAGALSALRYQRVAMDVASGNVANVNTPGYARRMSVAQAVGAPAVPALWSRWDGAADGVEVGGLRRVTDALLDARSRTEHAGLSYLDTRAASLVRFETTIGEPGEGGVAAALSAFKQAWHDVANSPADEAARSQLLGRGETLRAAVASQASAVTTEWSDSRSRLDAALAETNKVAGDLAKLNEALQAAHVSGEDAGTLLDQRDQLALRLSQLTGATVSDERDSMFDLTLGGQPLVTGNTAFAVTASAPATMPGTTRGSVSVSVNGVALSALKGELGASRDLMNQDLPGYLERLDAFVVELVGSVNAEHAGGVDLDGDTPGDFFSGTGALDLAVLITNPRDVAAAAPGKGAYDTTVADALAVLDMGGGTYRSLVTDFGVQVASARRVAENQGILTGQVDASREALSGINVDEEMVNLLAAQRAYEGASRVITTLDSVLDTLINRTGLTR